MRKIYVSDSGNDTSDGLTHKTPIRSWKRFIQLCEGNDEIIIMGNADTGKMRLIAEIDKKGRIAQGGLEKVIMDIALPKIAQLVADARIELKLLGIDTEGKPSYELLNMAREQRNNSRLARPKPD